MNEPDKTPTGSRWPGWLLSLYLNGFCQTFVVCFVLLAALALADGGTGLIPAACLGAGVVATLFALVASPLLRPWREAMLPGQSPGRYLALSALVSASMLLWSVLTLAMMFAGLPYLLAGGLYMSPPAEELLPSLDLVLDGSGFFALGLAWLCGQAVCLLTRQAVQEQPSAVSLTRARLSRYLLSALLLLPYFLVLGRAGGALMRGARLDPSLRQAYQSELEPGPGQQALAPKDRLERALPPAFRDSPLVKAWLAGKEPLDRSKLLTLWCEHAARLSGGPKFWDTPSLVALARVADLENIVGAAAVPAPLRAEWMVRSAVILLEWGGSDPTDTHRLYELDLPAAEWERLLDLALARADLAQGASLSDQDVRDRFVDAAARVLTKRDRDMDGKLRRQLFQRSDERAALNRLWQAFQAGKPYPEVSAPPSPESFRQRYASSLGFDLRAVDADISQATFKEDLARQTLAYNIVLMELKRLEAEGARLPGSWDEFRPEVAAIAKAYAEWIELSALDREVTIRRKEPREGMSLTHRFGQPR